jgi:prepilin-type N-terminal cleavage/methylation domain-containing protein
VLERLKMRRDRTSRTNSGFSLLEMLISMVVLLGITGIVMTAMLQTTRTEGTVQNRTEMHASVRSATELLQQEIGQAGRVALPSVANIQMTTAVVAGSATPTLTAGATAGMFANEYLVVDAGASQETVQISAISGNTITANFLFAHAANVPVTVQGGFGTGVVPESAAPYNMANGSDGTHLKLYGDINGDGNMVYVEYVCDYAASGNLYRSISAYDAANIVAKQVLLPNLVSTGNPGGTPCFVYQERPVGCNSTATNPCFVTDVAVTLTVQTQLADPSTGLYQKETKALLNVSPRNVFDAYELSTLSNNRVQPMPATVTALLSQTP